VEERDLKQDNHICNPKSENIKTIESSVNHQSSTLTNNLNIDYSK